MQYALTYIVIGNTITVCYHTAHYSVCFCDDYQSIVTQYIDNKFSLDNFNITNTITVHKNTLLLV